LVAIPSANVPHLSSLGDGIPLLTGSLPITQLAHSGPLFPHPACSVTVPRGRQTASGKEAISRVLFSHEGTDYLEVWRLPDSNRLEAAVSYLARPRTPEGMGELVEVTVLPRGASRMALVRLEEEVKLTARLEHPAIARVHGLYTHSGDTFLVAEHVEGCSLESVGSLTTLRQKLMSQAFAVYVASEVAGALHYAHTLTDEQGCPLGIVHRGVGSESIRVGLRSGVVKLADFAFAYSLLPERAPSPERLIRGIIDTAAPERLALKGRPGVDFRADLFSLGVLLLELLTGRTLYDLDAVETAAQRALRAHKRRARLVAEVPSWVPVTDMAMRAAAVHPMHVAAALRDAGVSTPVGDVVRKLLRHDPAERYATAAQVRADLQACLNALEGGPYGAEEAARELRQARDEAEVSPLREELGLFEMGVFKDDVPPRPEDTRCPH
ncbi:MAG TPA: protein kinase, partial [Archangium sp.]|uniref:protein kinase domain-containing protein n=1 Tax=Archangium sp. TaxID=1872627 RepID=UPI002E35AE55